MPDPLIRSTLAQNKMLLLVVAAPNEFRAIHEGVGAPSPHHPPYWTPLPLTSAAEIVLTGVGKANAAGASAYAYDPMRHGALLSFGIAGILPNDAPQKRPVAIGDAVAATSCVFADEGVLTPEGFTEIDALGFPLGSFSGSSFPVDPSLFKCLRQVSDAEGGVATVSSCSGTDVDAAEVARRTGALAECMEGAAVALVGHRLGIPTGELRVLSNTTGNRATQKWDIPRAFARLGEVTRRLVGSS